MNTVFRKLVLTEKLRVLPEATAFVTEIEYGELLRFATSNPLTNVTTTGLLITDVKLVVNCCDTPKLVTAE